MVIDRHILDGPAIRRRRAELRLSARDVGGQLGGTGQVVTSIERGTNHPDLTLATVARLARALAVDITTLFGPGTAAPEAVPAGATTAAPSDDSPGTTATCPDDGDGTDVAALGSLLFCARILTPLSALAEALGWPLERVEAALGTLSTQLPLVGLRLHRLNGKAGIARSVEALEAKAAQAVIRKHLQRDGLSVAEARMVYRVARTGLPTTPNNAEATAMGVLANAGLLVFVPRGDLALADDVRLSLFLDEDPDPPPPGADAPDPVERAPSTEDAPCQSGVAPRTTAAKSHSHAEPFSDIAKANTATEPSEKRKAVRLSRVPVKKPRIRADPADPLPS